ncbi:hypothetical protein HELRODRAFT_117195 [Helobdella robusta]|uniref:Uncharacterized protein n=1 Tax=Helobdella robusta TaxID=6412 RepID=T1EGK9_HELRO|nr:hypothetical protein HELRODRAFT_117195 [Helobdella robusta]ESO08692.1 hypothetical protein HELRODRAFT_117195 [Helobdella robusta]
MFSLKYLDYFLAESDISLIKNVKSFVFENLGYCLPEKDFYLTVDGKVVNDDAQLVPNKFYRLHPRLVAGKGGFGSMLRALGAQIEKTTNREACRDLSGRRMRDVNNEKKLREWTAKVGKNANKELEKAIRRKEKRERMKRLPQHKFEDEKYYEQKKKIAEDLNEAIKYVLTAFANGPIKRKAEETKSNSKIAKLWLGADVDDTDDEEDDGNATHNNNATTGNSACSSSSSCGASKVGAENEDGPSCSGGHNVPCSSNSNLAIIDGEDSDDDCDETDDSDDDEDDNAEDPIINDNNDYYKNVERPQLYSSSPTSTMASSSATTLSSLATSTQQNGQQITNAINETDKRIDDDNSNKNVNPTLTETKPTATETTPSSAAQPTPDIKVNLNDYNSPEELAELGMEVLKKELTDRGLKCGGTLIERASRLFSVKGLNKDKIPKKLLAKK